MIRDPHLSFYLQLSYRSPKSTANAVGSFSATVEVTRYFPAADDAVAGALDEALTHVTSGIEAGVDAVVSGPIGQEVIRLKGQMADAVAVQTELAAKTHELQRRRSDVIRGDGKGPAIKQANDRLHAARADHARAGELVTEVGNLLVAAETRLYDQKLTARIASIQKATQQATADLQAQERAAALVIAEALAPVYVTSSVLRELGRQRDAARTPKAAPLPPMSFPDSTSRHQPRMGGNPFAGDWSRATSKVEEADESDDDLGIPGPVEILS